MGAPATQVEDVNRVVNTWLQSGSVQAIAGLSTTDQKVENHSHSLLPTHFLSVSLCLSKKQILLKT